MLSKGWGGGGEFEGGADRSIKCRILLLLIYCMDGSLCAERCWFCADVIAHSAHTCPPSWAAPVH